MMKLLPFIQAHEEAKKCARIATKNEKMQAVMFLSYAISILEGDGKDTSSPRKEKIVPILNAYKLKADSLLESSETWSRKD